MENSLFATQWGSPLRGFFMSAFALPAPLLGLYAPSMKSKTEEVHVRTINLRDYYPTKYQRDHLIL